MFEGDTISNNDVFCKISYEYQQYLREIEDRDIDGEDEFLTMCALFLHMSDDLFLFIQSYRAADSIATIKGYDWFVAARTAALGQHKYVAPYHEQFDMLLDRLAYSLYAIVLPGLTHLVPGRGVWLKTNILSYAIICLLNFQKQEH